MPIQVEFGFSYASAGDWRNREVAMERNAQMVVATSVRTFWTFGIARLGATFVTERLARTAKLSILAASERDTDERQ